jgi:ATP-dependent DNA ligase
MPLQSRRLPFDDSDWLFELKYNGFRALAIIEHGRVQLISRNGNPFASFSDLTKNIAASIPDTTRTVLDGEIVCLDGKGRPQFRDLLFHRGDPCFFAFERTLYRDELAFLVAKFGGQAVIIAAAIYIILSGEVCFRYPRK